MKIEYNKDVDILCITFNDNKIVESEKIPGMIIDLDEKDEIIGIEILEMKKFADLLATNIQRQRKK
jgi:uncharacterized protein YuzE